MPLWLGAKRAPQVQAEEALLDGHEGQGPKRRQHPEDGGQVKHSVQAEQHSLDGRGTIPSPEEIFNPRDMQSDPFQQEKGKEQPRLVASQNPPGALAVPHGVSGESQCHGSLADVRVPADHVGVSVMGVVLGHPPAKAQSRQHVRHDEPHRTVGPARREYLLVAGVVAEEHHLGGQESEKCGNAQRSPGITHREQRHPAPGKSHDSNGHRGRRNSRAGGAARSQSRIRSASRP